MKCFQSLCPIFLFLSFSQFFLFHVISKQLLCHLRRPFCVLCGPCLQLFFQCLARSTKQTWKSCFSLCSRCLEVMGARKNGRERETGEGWGSACPDGPRKSFQLAFCECGYLQLVERLPKGESNRAGWENSQSVVHGQRSEGLILPPPAPETTKWYNGSLGLGGHFSLV